MVLAFSIRLAGVIHAYRHAYVPTNIVIRYLRSAGGRTWVPPISLACAIAYLAATAVLNADAPWCLNILCLTAVWNTVKFACAAALETLLVLRRGTGVLLCRTPARSSRVLRRYRVW